MNDPITTVSITERVIEFGDIYLQNYPPLETRFESLVENY